MSKVITSKVETSLTLEYRMFSWGLERIVLDGISNHLPSDSNGTSTTVKLKQDGQFVDFKQADRTKPVEEVVFEDDGSGYGAGLLSVLYSPKAADSLSIGQFGEGLKLVAAAALRNGLNLEYRSKNWRATPYAKPERIGGHDVRRLCFKVVMNGDRLSGSRTAFTNPSPALLEEVFQLPAKVLAFNDTYRELHTARNNYSPGFDDNHLKMFLKTIDFSTIETPSYSINVLDPSQNYFRPSFAKPKNVYHSRIIDLCDGTTALFIKGIKFRESSSIFSYDLGLDNISPDRFSAEREAVLNQIRDLLRGCTNPEVIEKVLAVAHLNPYGNYDEFNAFADRSRRSEIGHKTKIFLKEEIETDLPVFKKFQNEYWVAAFKKLFGENAVVASSDTNVNSDVAKMGYNPVTLNYSIANFLYTHGILSADKVQVGQEYRWVDQNDLTAQERSMLEFTNDINAALSSEPVNIEVRVYSGLYVASGREIESSNGVFVTEADGTKYIGIKRDRLKDLADFADTYVHELDHLLSGAKDNTREFEAHLVGQVVKLLLRHHLTPNKSE